VITRIVSGAAPDGVKEDLDASVDAGEVVYELADLVRGYLHASGRRRPLVSVQPPGDAVDAFRAGANLALTGP
jgi:hypothetical protein